MTDINRNRTFCDEFSIYRLNSPYCTPRGAYLVELNGEEGGDCNVFKTIAEAHALIKRWAKSAKLTNAGVTELFGRNRQFTITPRYGFKKYLTPSAATC